MKIFLISLAVLAIVSEIVYMLWAIKKDEEDAYGAKADVVCPENE